MNEFLASIEVRAFRIAELRLGDRDSAHDAVQDAMLKLVTNYSERPESEWTPLFYRILANRVHDFQRRTSLHRRLFMDERDPELADPVESSPGPEADNPARELEDEALWQDFSGALAQLPVRQQETLIFRLLEGMSVTETALAMDCSEGTVKTQYSRAMERMRSVLGSHLS